MKAKSSQWYRHGWSLDIKNQSWVEDTPNQVAFLIKALTLTGSERILDLACGFGRHSLVLAAMGFDVVGADITADYMEDATRSAAEKSLPAQFILSDIRDLHFEEEFDVVLNLADGAIGYLEDDCENLKIFDVVSRALKPGGKHFIDICSADHAEAFFPKHGWEIGERELSLSEFEWDAGNRRMLFGGWQIPYGEIVHRPEIAEGDSIRLYSLEELKRIYSDRGMQIERTFSDYHGNPASSKELQLMVYAQKER